MSLGHERPPLNRDPYGLATALFAERARWEVETVGAVLADPARLVPVAAGEGVDADAFFQEDLRLIWLACDVARGRPVSFILRLARRAMGDAGEWAWHWSDEGLCGLAGSYFPSPSLVRVNARNLLALARRLDEVRRLEARILDLLKGEADPRLERRRPTFVAVPPPPRRHAHKRGAAA